MRSIGWLLLMLAAGSMTTAAAAQRRGGAPTPGATPTPERPAAARGEREEPREETVVTTHTLTVGGRTIRYTATAGTMLLRRERDGEFQPTASIFYIAYEKLGEPDKSRRPLMFSFNGGPGSSSVWLHLGVLGPRRVRLDDEGRPGPPPYGLVENEYSLLPATDLVFIDPVSTGYSRALPGEPPSQFHGLTQDIEAVAEFIRLYTTRNQRWLSPKFIIGESYGTTRASGLADYLQDTEGMDLNGVALVSAILNWANNRPSVGMDLPYELFLPTFTAVAWYHKRLPDDLQQRPLVDVLREAEAFVNGPYDDALRQGDRLTPEARAAMTAQLARFTGVEAKYWDEVNLRLTQSRFAKALLRDQRRTVGRYDGRYTGIDREAAGESPEFDPSDAAVQGLFTAAFNDYVSRDLNYRKDLPYEVLASVRPWDFGPGNQMVNVAETLRRAMSYNPHLKVFVANGYYDQATPYYATVYTIDHLQLDPQLRGNVTMAFYEAGHMMYLRRADLAKLSADLAQFIRDATPEHARAQ